MNQKIQSLVLLFGLAMLPFVFTSCEKDPEPPIEEEVITTLTYTLTPTGGGNAVIFRFQDLDGDGGNAGTITNGTLAANTTYTGSMELLNESETPAEDVTEEINEEDEEHQFFFQVTTPDVTIGYADVDGNNNPVGLATTVTTGAAASGTMTVILRHEPNKDASGVSDGDITNAGGETDIEVTFTLDVQ